MAVNVPVSDLRAQPHTAAQPDIHDPLEETQLLYGERVRVLAIQDGWAQVEAVEQPEFTQRRRWQGYPGWMPVAALVPADSLAPPTVVVTERWAPAWQDHSGRIPSSRRFPMGTRLRAVDMGGQIWKVELLDGATVWMPFPSARPLDEVQALPPRERRRLILRSAQSLIGEPYYWGGRSPRTTHPDGLVAGVDCSGLVNLAYRTAGIEIPRDAHEQFLRAAAVKVPQPADLVFLSERGNPQHIVHVMLYAGDGELIEGPGTGMTVRRVSVTERLGQPLDWVAPGAVTDGQTVFFGAYLP